MPEKHPPYLHDQSAMIDLWDAHGLGDKKLIERAIRDSVKVTGASLLHIHLHRFTPSGGISGIANLAESHISLHTWPERGYAAIDLFTCGSEIDPWLAYQALKRAFRSVRDNAVEVSRGLGADE